MEHEGLDAESTIIGVGYLVIDHIEVAVVDVDSAAVDVQPAPPLKTPPPQPPITDTSPLQPTSRRDCGWNGPRE